MTTFSTSAAETSVIPDPLPDTPVLLKRRINPAADAKIMSVYADDRWNLTPGLFEAHVPTTRLNFTDVPVEFKDPLKRYVWCLINEEAPRRLRMGRVNRLALRSIALDFPRFVSFVQWLADRGIRAFKDVTTEILNDYQVAVIGSEVSGGMKAAMLSEVVRFWSYRPLLPEALRLPAPPPWDGENSRDLLGYVAKGGVNRTPRISTETIDGLLMWALRFVEVFADDIIGALKEYLCLWAYSPGLRDRSIRERFPQQSPPDPDQIAKYLDSLRRKGESLPGSRMDDGTMEIHWPHLSRVFRCGEKAFKDHPKRRALVKESGLPVSDHVPVGSQIVGEIDGNPWLTKRIDYSEARPLAELLRTACFIVIAYLSGMRTGEVLNLERGCVSHDAVTGLWTIQGRKFKGAIDSSGEKIPEGEIREDPWVVVEHTAKAVSVLERLHDQPLLFTTRINPLAQYGGPGVRIGGGRSAAMLAHDVADFIEWVNRYAEETGRFQEVIPEDPVARIAPSRFRRTLAWHIVRKPRGLIAGAIQYGHVHVQMTLGYSGTYDSGFPDEKAFEDWLYRLEQLEEDHEQLREGEHVSGPAAPVYRTRVEAAHEKFGGRVLKNAQQARDMLGNPLLQIFPGKAMTCVFDPAKALCQMRGSEADSTVTPDQTDCRPNCRNKAYTDRNIVTLRQELEEMKAIQAISLAPSPRYLRIAATTERIQQVISDHELGGSASGAARCE